MMTMIIELRPKMMSIKEREITIFPNDVAENLKNIIVMMLNTLPITTIIDT